MAAQLRGIDPEMIEKRFKCFWHGDPGVGKTIASLQFPSPYYCDLEKGAENKQYVKLLKKAKGKYFKTADFDDLLHEITTLHSVSHQYRTVVLDPFTTIYAQLLDKTADRLITDKNPDGTAKGAHYGKADRMVRRMMNMLSRLDMNVIMTSHSKILYGENLTKLGNTFDSWKSSAYFFDLVIEVQMRGAERIGIVKKTRCEEFPMGLQFPFSYDEIANRYGRENLERGAVSEPLAEDEQVKEITDLVHLLKISIDDTDRWLEKGKATMWSEMPKAAIQKCIDHLKKKITAPESVKPSTIAATAVA